MPVTLGTDMEEIKGWMEGAYLQEYTFVSAIFWSMENNEIGTEFIDCLVSKLRAVQDDGSRTTAHGARLIGKLPPLLGIEGSGGYLHAFYPRLSESQIDKLQLMVARRIPEDFRRLLGAANGFFLFAGSLSFGGYRLDYSRKAGDEGWQPVSLEYGNTVARPLEGEPGKEVFADNSDEIRIGFYSTDPGYEVVMKLGGDSGLFAAPRGRKGPVFYRWPDLESLITTEVDRMTTAFLSSNGAVTRLNPIPPPWQMC
jgi:hypothetical protein